MVRFWNTHNLTKNQIGVRCLLEVFPSEMAWRYSKSVKPFFIKPLCVFIIEPQKYVIAGTVGTENFLLVSGRLVIIINSLSATVCFRNDLAVLEQLVNKISDLAVAMSHFVGPDADRNFSSPDNENSDEKTRIKSEWMLVANCLDRIFAIVFFIANITVTFYFFLPYYLS